MTDRDDADLDSAISTLFNQIGQGDVEEAIDNLFARSGLATQIAEKVKLSSYISNLVALDGPIVFFELVAASDLGTLCRRRVYLTQHTRTITRWEFAFIKLPTGWTTVHLALNQAAQDWM